jgi:hypothetical protein
MSLILSRDSTKRNECYNLGSRERPTCIILCNTIGTLHDARIFSFPGTFRVVKPEQTAQFRTNSFTNVKYLPFVSAVHLVFSNKISGTLHGSIYSTFGFSHAPSE